ncbi:hypothetical protein ACJMK2_012168 [Sinanodonta woodiana]|uniref:non-specific serine/threonine protein kinase n=1 Tax=Sinanodonta woodiana TaxID=1069815 RepID=A0ABD3V7C2_SINWO
MNIMEPVINSYGEIISVEELNKTYDLWVHTGRNVDIKKTSSDSPVARHKLRSQGVYEVNRHVRGKAILISNTGYQALKLLKSAFEQLQFRISVHVDKSTEQILEILRNEAKRQDTKTANAIVFVIYGTPDNFEMSELPKVFSAENCPQLIGKPKMFYVIGNDIVIQQMDTVIARNLEPDYFVGATGFFGIMFYIYVLHLFAHELDVASLWKLEQQFSILHNYSERSHSTLRKEFYFFPGLSTSDMPQEIEQMDPNEIELYLKMVEKSSMKTYNMRLMFVGLYGAGKTSLVRRIMNRDIEGVTSTDGIDVYIGRCRVNLRTGEWTISEDVSHKPYAKLSRLWNENPEEEAKLPSREHLASNQSNKRTRFMDDIIPVVEKAEDDSKNVMEAEDAGDKDKDVSSQQAQMIQNHQKKTTEENYNFNQNTSNPEAMETESSTEIMDTQHWRTAGTFLGTAVKVLKESKISERKTDPEALVSLWDFAGQFTYYATHQLFFSPRAIYLLVLNMTQNLTTKIEEKWFLDLEGIKDVELHGGVLFWLKSIYTYSRSAILGIPPIILVGTHKDRIEGTEFNKRKHAEEYFGRIFNAVMQKRLERHVKLETFLVDNTTEDQEVDRLRKYILETASSLPSWGEMIPARWVEMEQVLEEIRAEGKFFLTMRELVDLDSKMSIPIKEKEQLALFLKYENAVGALIYFDEEGLRDTIIIEPSWIIHAFRFLISATCFDDKYGPLKEDWHLFNEKGQLKIELAERIWKLDKENGFFENRDILFMFLDKLDIMSKAKVINELGQIEEQDFYFVPCLLKESPTEGMLATREEKDILSSSTLCFTFKDDFLPPAVFNRIMSICLGMWPPARQGKRQLLFCGCGVFQITPDTHSDRYGLTIFFKDSKIGLRVTRYATVPDASVDSRLCDKIRRLITLALEKELTRYQRSIDEHPDKTEKAYEYAVICPETHVSKLVTDGLLKVDALMQYYKQKRRYFCYEHTERDHPHSLEPADLLKDWFPDLVNTFFKYEYRLLKLSI